MIDNRYIAKFLKTALLPLFCIILLTGFVTNALGQHASSSLSRGVMLYQQGDYRQAIEPLQQAMKGNPNELEAYLYLASAYLGAKQYQEVIQTARKGLAVKPGQIRLMLLEAEGYYHTDKPKALPVYHKIEEMLQQAPGRQIDGIGLEQIRASLGQLYQERANKFYREDSLDKAAKAYEKAKNYSPDSLDIQNNLAYVLLKDKRWEDALEVLGKATKRFPDSNQLLLMQGQAYRGAKQWKEMTETFRRLYERDTANINNALIYGQSLLMTNKAQQANTFLHQLLKRHPKEKRLYKALKGISERRYDFNTKRNILKLERSAFPRDTAVAEELAQTDILIKNYTGARQIYDSLSIATESPEYKLYSARTWLYTPNYKEASEAYQQLVALYPARADILEEAALVNREAGAVERATELYRQAYRLKQQPEVALALSEIFIRQKDTALALKYAAGLAGSEYEGIGMLYELKYGDKEIDRGRSITEMKGSIIGILGLYQSFQKLVLSRAKKINNRNEAMLPPLLQDRRMLNVIGRYIDDWYAYLTGNYSYEEAVHILDSAISEYPSSSKLYFFKGKTAVQHKDFNRGILSLRKAIRLGAKDPEVHYMLANAYVQTGDIRTAVITFEQTLTLDEKFEKAYRKLVEVSQKYDLLDALCDRWLSRYNNNRNNTMLREYLIEALQKAGRFDEAREIVKQK